jgi:hypothetical protein
MASVRSPVTLPESIRAALEIRKHQNLVCPPAIEKQMQKLSFFRTGGGSSGGGNRFINLGRVAPPDGWRTSQGGGYGGSHGGGGGHGGSHGSGHGSSHNTTSNQSHGRRDNRDNDGFEVWTNRKRNTNPRPGPPPVTSVVQEHIPSADAWKPSRFQTLEEKISSESVEDRIMGKVRSKINKIGESTYEPTKVFMQQILDSGETDFLAEFMEFVFQKAATEPSFCAIYARLLHELADEFSHLRTEMQNRFREYTTIFCETEKTPDVGTADYVKFVESQEKKKFRRGYSQFVAELTKLGEVNFADFRSLIESIVGSIQKVYLVPDNTLLCEEYVDCLSRMCIAGASMLSKEKWANEQIRLLSGISSSPRSSSPGLSNKARFALMDLQDFVERGWKN